MKTSRLDLIFSVICCLQTSIRGAFTDEVVPPPSHIFLADQPTTPFCLGHSFAYIRYLGSGVVSLTGKTNDCLKGFEEKFEIVLGTCSPPPPSILAIRGLNCDSDELYGECPPCGTEFGIWTPSLDSDCLVPVVNEEGLFDWPEQVEVNCSITQFTGYLLAQRYILRSKFLKVFCQCFQECGADVKGQAKFNIESLEPWCDGNFQGSRMVVEGSID